ncbi:MAG: hypothetical protein AAGB93_23890 [Planctomycetota bacterium]
MIRSLPPRARAPRLVCAAAAAAACTAALAAAPAPQDDGWVVLPLPADLGDAGSAGMPALLDGRHLYLEDGPREAEVTLGPLIPARAAEEIVWRAIQGAEQTSATVDSLGKSLLIRGPLEAREAGAAALAELGADLEALQFEVRARLERSSATDNQREAVFDEARRVRSGASASFGARSTRSFLADFDVEVANEMAIADPVVGSVLEGETLHLWVSSFLDETGARRPFVQGLFDIAHVTASSTFDPDVFELGPITQPRVASVQVVFAGPLDARGQLSVDLSGLAGDWTDRLLTIRVAPSEATTDAARIVDLGRGLWRGRLTRPHALFGEERGLQITAGPTPSSLSQLFFATGGRSQGPRPVLGEAIVVFDAPAVASASRMRGLAEGLDPREPTAGVSVQLDGVRAVFRASEGALLRVASVVETTYVADYDPQVASVAALSDPISRIATSGVVVEATLQDGVLVGRGMRSATEIEAVRAVSPADIGRIQLPVRTETRFPLRVRAGETARPAEGIEVLRGDGAPPESPR